MKTDNVIHAHPLTAAGLLVALGIVFGDIGTSPLYVMKAIRNVNPGAGADYIIGAVSCVIWTLTLQTTVKYVLVALRADNNGEGGILALYSLVKRLRYKWLYVVAAVGASTLIADGVITPAVTVTSAIEGLGALYPQAPVVGISILIIALIFVVQQFGTSKIGRCFGPFMLCWFLMLGGLGVASLGCFPAILKAFNPLYAVRLLVDYPGWFLVLGAVFLCTTGAEALYSDLGHCGRKNISVSWIFVKVMLILNYLGQGAWLIANRGVAGADLNPFYAIMPQWMLPLGIVMSTGAAIIASQALISGSFTIFSEAINLNFWPRLRIKYPTVVKGQLYIPSVNWFLMGGCILTVLLFRTSSAMEAAYGLAITVTMLMTTCLLCFYMGHKGVSRIWVAVFAVVFTCIEGCFLVANMFKFVHGGWYTILLAGLVCAVMLAWHKAHGIRMRYFEYKNLADYGTLLTDISRDREIPKYASNLVYLSNSEQPDRVESKILYSIINKQPKRADRYWLLRVDFVDTPDTLTYEVEPHFDGLLWSVGLKIGFRVPPQISMYFRQVVEDLVGSGKIDLVSDYPSLRRHGIAGNFRFGIIRRIFSPSSLCGNLERTVMLVYERLRRMALSPEQALGLDTSNTTIENVPLIIARRTPRRIVPEK
ncbi:MAG: KUP/HAK/KT family potassium transporter [Bacteroides sp.]|nr:KUP/HAK/KT family potassium transporter [Bacteroides sp.]MCM1457443.1 KUP/HAK/KT family potassium transporter [Lachnoclostridium sp.]